MNRCYFDTSAVAKLLLEERESEDVRRWVGHADVEPVSSLLLETELRRVAWHQGVAQGHVTAVLGHFELHEVPAWEWRAAGLIPGRSLRSLDALHVAAAIRVEADALVSYDERMIEAASLMGLAVVQPGVDREGEIQRIDTDA